MAINQITIFLENKAGALLNVTKILADNKVDLRAINIAETADYGLLRLITANNTGAKKVLKDEGLLFTETPVLAIAIEDKPGALSGDKAAEILKANGMVIAEAKDIQIA